MLMKQGDVVTALDSNDERVIFQTKDGEIFSLETGTFNEGFLKLKSEVRFRLVKVFAEEPKAIVWPMTSK